MLVGCQSQGKKGPHSNTLKVKRVFCFCPGNRNLEGNCPENRNLLLFAGDAFFAGNAFRGAIFFGDIFANFESKMSALLICLFFDIQISIGNIFANLEWH